MAVLPMPEETTRASVMEVSIWAKKARRQGGSLARSSFRLRLFFSATETKIGATAAVSGNVAVGGHAVRGPVVEALVGLGFAAKLAEETTDRVLAGDPDASTSTALRAALNLLGKTT